MADLKYNNVWLDLIKTNSYDADPVYDPSGMDQECVKVSIQVTGVFHDMWHGGGKEDGSANPQAGRFSLGHRGWTAGVSLANLRETLMRPRGHLQFWMGSTLVLEAPMRDQANTLYSCDVKGGPFPQSCAVTEIIGHRAAVVVFRIEAFVSVCDHYVLSNRWRMESDTDEFGYATNIIHGRASLRHDFMHRAGLQADDFRKWLVLPPDKFMKRDKVSVSISEDNGTVDYTVVDRHVNYGTGDKNLIAKVNCQITGGVESTINSYRNVAERFGTVAKGVATGIVPGLQAFGQQLFDTFVPVCKLNGAVQIWGQLGNSRQRLLITAIAILFDRIGFDDPANRQNPLSKGKLASLYATLDWSSEGPPYVEVRGEFFGTQRMFVNGRDHILDFWLDEKIKGSGGVRLDWNSETPTAELPHGGNTRSLRACRLVTQVLTGPYCQRPSDPPAIGQGGRSVVAPNTSTGNG